MTQIFNRLVIILATATLLCELSSTACFANNDDSKATISVSGNAEIEVQPDHGVFTFSIESQEESLDAAMQDNDAKVKAVVDFLKQSQIEAKDIQTQVISISPVFESKFGSFKGKSLAAPNFQAPNQNLNRSINAPMLPRAAGAAKSTKDKPSGYRAKRDFSITISKLDKFEEVYRGLIKQGVNNISGISLRTSELQKHMDAARLKAVQTAREKATAMAGQLGAKLGSIDSIRETNDSGWRTSRGSFSAPRLSTPTFSSESANSDTIEIRASVSIVFILRDTELAAEDKD